MNDHFWERIQPSVVGVPPAIQGIQAMVRVFSTTGPLQGRDFVLGVLSGIILTLAGVIWFAQLGLFPKESQALILSADYRLSRNEMQLREQVRYLEHELDVLRRARSSTAGYTGRTGS